MEIDHRSLKKETLDALIEEFVTRDGTDYGSVEVTTAVKKKQIYQQILVGKAVITFDSESESCTIIAK